MPTIGSFYRESYEPVRLAMRSPSTRADYRSVVATWEGWSQEAKLANLTLGSVCEFLSWIAKTRSPSTAKKYRSYLRAILHFALKRHAVDLDWIDDIPSVKVPKRVPQAFTVEQLSKILEICLDETGEVGGIPASAWWFALVLVIYDTGLRIRAALSIRSEDVDLDRMAVLVRGETQKQSADQMLGISEQTATALAPLLANDPLLFGWHVGVYTLRRKFKRILKRAGVPFGSRFGGVFHKIRRSTASYCKAGGGDPTYQLGHSSPSVTDRYLDPLICGVTTASAVLPRPRVDRQRRLF